MDRSFTVSICGEYIPTELGYESPAAEDLFRLCRLELLRKGATSRSLNRVKRTEDPNSELGTSQMNLTKLVSKSHRLDLAGWEFGAIPTATLQRHRGESF